MIICLNYNKADVIESALETTRCLTRYTDPEQSQILISAGLLRAFNYLVDKWVSGRLGNQISKNGRQFVKSILDALNNLWINCLYWANAIFSNEIMSKVIHFSLNDHLLSSVPFLNTILSSVTVDKQVMLLIDNKFWDNIEQMLWIRSSLWDQLQLLSLLKNVVDVWSTNNKHHLNHKVLIRLSDPSILSSIEVLSLSPNTHIAELAGEVAAWVEGQEQQEESEWMAIDTCTHTWRSIQ